MRNSVLIVILSGSVFAAHMARARDASDPQNQMMSQVEVTQNVVDQVLAQLKNSTDPNSKLRFSHPDYLAKASEFNQKVEPALVKFEQKMTQILTEANFYAQRIEEIKSSPGYTEEQKRSLTDSQMKDGEVVFKDLSKRYTEAMIELYTLDLPEPKTLGFSADFIKKANADFIRESNNPKIREQIHWNIERSEIKTGRYYLDLGVYFRDVSTSAFQIVVRDGCYTSGCITLYSQLRTSYLDMLSRNMKDTITIYRTDDNYALQIRRDDYLVLKRVRSFVEMRDGATLGLPFDMSPEQYRHINAVDEVTALLLTPSIGFWGKWDCPAQVAQIKKELCDAGACLTTQEEAKIIGAVTKEGFTNEGKRIRCLKGD